MNKSWITLLLVVLLASLPATPLLAAEEGFAAMRAGTGIKVIVDPQRER